MLGEPTSLEALLGIALEALLRETTSLEALLGIALEALLLWEPLLLLREATSLMHAVIVVLAARHFRKGEFYF